MGLVSRIKSALQSRNDAPTPDVSQFADDFPDKPVITPKQAEKYIIEEVLAGRMVFRHRFTTEFMYTADHYECGTYKFRVEYPSMGGGSFSYGYVGDCDVSNCRIAEFDLQRVIKTIKNGVDPGETKLGIHSLWEC